MTHCERVSVKSLSVQHSWLKLVSKSLRQPSPSSRILGVTVGAVLLSNRPVVRRDVLRPGWAPDVPARVWQLGDALVGLPCRLRMEVVVRFPWGCTPFWSFGFDSHSRGREPRYRPSEVSSFRTDRPALGQLDTSRCCPREQDWVMVTAMGAVPDSVASGTDQCPDYALCKPNTPIEAPSPAPNFGAVSRTEARRGRPDRRRPAPRARPADRPASRSLGCSHLLLA